MKISITSALSMLFLTFVCVIFVNVLSAQMQMARINTAHYGIVQEIESSDFSPAVIQQMMARKDYQVRVENRSVKDDLRIYQITTTGTIRMPIFNYAKAYVKESCAR